MEKGAERLRELLIAYSEGACNTAERLELMELLRRPENAHELERFVNEAVARGADDKDLSPARADEVFRQVMLMANPRQAININKYRWLVAASVTLLIGLGTYFFLSPRNMNTTATSTQKNANPALIPPASTRATLTLGDGTIINLDSTSSQVLAHENGSDIIRFKDGTLLYKPGKVASHAIIYNTISTPKGGQYHIILPDGSDVWLNAASTLRFPSSFVNADRQIELSGEAYFEISKNPQKPFVVNIKGSRINVLGTHFNVNGYADETEINTTLLEGSIKFSHNNREQLLRPGQQVIFKPADESMKLADADIAQVMSWKNGFFEFENLELPVIMRQIARWYDVDIVYRKINTGLKLSGGISRKLSLQDLQKLMEANGAPFTIEGRTIIVGH